MTVDFYCYCCCCLFVYHSYCHFFLNYLQKSIASAFPSICLHMCIHLIIRCRCALWSKQCIWQMFIVLLSKAKRKLHCEKAWNWVIILMLKLALYLSVYFLSLFIFLLLLLFIFLLCKYLVILCINFIMKMSYIDNPCYELIQIIFIYHVIFM